MLSDISRNIDCEKQPISNKLHWWGIPFLLASFIQGFPIAGGLKEQSEQWAETIYESTQANATTLGFKNTIVLALFWGILYFMSIGMVWKVFRASALWRLWPYFMTIALMMVSLFWQPFPEKVLVNIVHNVGVFAIAYAAAYNYREDPKKLLTHLGLILGLNLAIHTIGVFYIPLFAIQLDGRWCGLSANANTLGSIGFIALWANATALEFSHGGVLKIHLLFCLLASIVLVGAQSVTSILCALVAVGGTYLLKIHFMSRYNLRIRAAWLGLAFIFTALMVILFITNEQLFLFESVGRTSTLSGRQSIWLDAVNLISNELLLGYGFDDNAYANQLSGMPHTTYHNGFLDLAVRGGLVTLTLLILLLIRWYRSLGKANELPISYVICFLPFVLASIFYNITEVTFYSARNILWIILLVIIITPEILFSQHRQDFKRNVI